jgi:hypothetical protein
MRDKQAYRGAQHDHDRRSGAVWGCRDGKGRLTPASNPGGLAALLAIKPTPASHADDTAEVVSELREDHR